MAVAPAIHATHVRKLYGNGVVALADLSLEVRSGVFGFLGPNGAGKTTAVKILLGLSRPTSGGGAILGAPFGSKQALRRVGTFSKGMQQRLGLGVALLGDPTVVLLDEPTSALDPVGRHDVREIIRTLRERGTVVFLNSHLLTEVEQVCDSVAIVDRGKVIAEGPLAELLRTSSLRVRATDLTREGRAALARFGEIDEASDGTILVRGIDLERVPDAVGALVATGARVYAVEPQHETLEERFLRLLGQ